MSTHDLYVVDVAFTNKRTGHTDWIVYAVPGEEAKGFPVRLDALKLAKRLADAYGKTTRVRINGQVHGHVTPAGRVVSLKYDAFTYAPDAGGDVCPDTLPGRCRGRMLVAN